MLRASSDGGGLEVAMQSWCGHNSQFAVFLYTEPSTNISLIWLDFLRMTIKNVITPVTLFVHEYFLDVILKCKKNLTSSIQY